MATNEDEVLKQQQLNQPVQPPEGPSGSANTHIIELQEAEPNAASPPSDPHNKLVDGEETKTEHPTPAKPPDTASSSNDGLIFELQTQLQSLQHRLEQIEKQLHQNPAPATPKNDTKPDTDNDNDDEPKLSRWDCLIHIVGLVVYKFFYVVHVIHSFIGRCIIRRLMKQVQANASVLDKYRCCMQICVAFNGLFYFVFPAVMLFCLVWSPFALYDEIQSWMIAYCTWALFVCLYWQISAREIFQYSGSKILPTINKTLWIVVGIALPEEKQKDKGYLSIMLASLLPAAVAGFVANFVLEEKFILDCDQADRLQDEQTVCTVEGQCCQIVSSHELSNIYQFGGTLVSNIIGTFAAIRILAWLMTKGDDELMAVAQRKK